MERSPIQAQMKKPISIWTSKMKLVMLAACVALAGCGGGFDGSARSASSVTGNFFGALTGSAGQREATVGSANVKIAGPEGYCVDPASKKTTGNTSFLLLASCSAITESSRAATPQHPAALLASVGNPTGQSVAADLKGLDTLLRSETGRGMLSRSKDARTVEVLESFAMDETLFVRVRDTSPNEQPGLSYEYWRAILDVKSSAVTLSVMAPREKPFSINTGLQILRSYVAEVKARNGLGPAPAPVAAAQPAQQPQQQAQQQQAQPAAQPAPTPRFNPLGSVGILRRLFS